MEVVETDKDKHVDAYANLVRAEVAYCWGRDLDGRPLVCFPASSAGEHELYKGLPGLLSYFKGFLERDSAYQKLGFGAVIDARNMDEGTVGQILDALSTQDLKENVVLYVVRAPEGDPVNDQLAAAPLTIKKAVSAPDELDEVISVSERSSAFGGPDLFVPDSWIKCHKLMDTVWLRCRRLFMHAMDTYKAHTEGRLPKFEVESVLPKEQVAALISDSEASKKKATETSAKFPQGPLHSVQLSMSRLEDSVNAVKELREHLDSSMDRIRLRHFANEIVTWAVLSMHYLANEIVSKSASASNISKQLEGIQAIQNRRPHAAGSDEEQTWKELSEEFEDLSDGLAKDMVQRADESLSVRYNLLTSRLTAEPDGIRGKTKEDVLADSSDEEEPGVESELAQQEHGATLPSLKRPSQVDYHRWVQGLGDSATSGQQKRRRQASTPEAVAARQEVEALVLRSPEEMEVELAEDVVAEEMTDSGLDKGAYLAMMRKRQELMDELVDTEQRYVEDLEAVLKNYYDDYDYAADSDIPAILRGKKNIVFSNLVKIWEFSKTLFLPALAANRKTPLKIATVIMEFERELGLYSLYFKNMPAQEELLQSALQFFRTIQIRLNDPFTFQSYLIKPMQRMAKYRQFLESFQQYTPHTEAMEKFHGELKMAIWLICFQLRHGNDLLALDRLKPSAHFNPAEQGLLLRQGDMIVQDKRGRRERRVFLFEELIVVTKKQKPAKGAKEGTYHFKDSVKVTDIGLTESVPNQPHKFEIFFRRQKDREVLVMTPLDEDHESSEENRAEWTGDIQRLLWQQFQKVKERVENVRVGVEGSLFGDKRASVIYGDHISFGPSSPGAGSPLSLRRPSVASSGSRDQSAGGGSQGPVYAVPTSTRRGRNISGPMMQQPGGGGTGPLYAVSAPITASEEKALPPIPDEPSSPTSPHPVRPPPPPPSYPTSASSGSGEYPNPYAQLSTGAPLYDRPMDGGQPGDRGTIYSEPEGQEEA